MESTKVMKWIEKTDDTVKQISILRMNYPDSDSRKVMNDQLDIILEQIDKLIMEHSDIVELSNCRSRTNQAKKLLNRY